MAKLWKIKAWVFDKFSNIIWLAVIAGILYLCWLAWPQILETFGFLDSEMGM
jgi:hypothetical protein